MFFDPNLSSKHLKNKIGISIEDDYIKDGRVDVKKLKPLARLGYMDYSVIDNIFEMNRPVN